MANDNKNNLKGSENGPNAAKKITDLGAGMNPRDTGQAVMGKANEYAHEAREKIGEWAGEAREAVNEFAERAGEKAQKLAGEMYDLATDNVSKFGRDVTNLVRKHPLPGLLIGFGVGLMIGRAVRIV